MITRRKLRWRIQHWLEARLPGLLTCTQFEAVVDAYIDGELGSVARAAVDFHTRTCPVCRRYLTAYRKVRDLAAETLTRPEAEALESVPDDLVAAILAARDAEPGAGST
ncbi:zf-HC2 domain-containing protein [Thalassobaculum sp. OXR-137]|uniref:anti-sigma factor family protein n=1 Tax=Thalassobaculum sp. OXR-137 TaxID=3100173 RepID=UPI002AC90F73|nr:zf-HC2 domain-containing protein [Thalassobaculum sp. OXR-137]WPZ33819.1 zf-HC2 domain-containing protein [Thalassobaculum sp. OXR-137]